MDTAITDHLLTTTRAVRRRLDLTRSVPREVVLECLRLSQQAPTGSNTQGWRWLVVTDEGRRSALADIYRRGSANYLASRSGTVDEQTQRVRESAIYLRDNLARVPVHVVPCVEGRVDGQPNSTAAPFYGSIFPAVWSFLLALRSRGLGSVLTTLHLHLESEAADLLDIPTSVTQVGLLPVAYFTGDGFTPAARPAVEEITYWDQWGSR